jgi:LacI family transcriptional regulator
MRVTRKRVAQYAGVSEATVSYVVNNGPRPVASETRARVLQAIRDLGYHPSDIARSLRLQRTSTIGLVVPDTANPFYGEIARIVENVSYARGYTAILCNSNLDPEREADYLNMLRTKRVEGIVLIPTHPDTVDGLLRDQIRTVVLEYDIEGAHCLVADDFEGGRLAVEHLLALGHCRIACITRAGDTSSSEKRVKGYRAALKRANVPVDDRLIVEAGASIASGEAAALRLLDLAEPPTAIFTHNDMFAIGVYSAVRKRGLRIPEDISLVGFDDIAEAAYLHPPLTTVLYPKQSMGERAAGLLIDLIQLEDHTIPPHTTVLGVTLVERESTAPPARRIVG